MLSSLSDETVVKSAKKVLFAFARDVRTALTRTHLGWNALVPLAAASALSSAAAALMWVLNASSVANLPLIRHLVNSAPSLAL